MTNEDTTHLEKLIFTGRITKHFTLQNIVFELQSLTEVELKNLEYLDESPTEHLMKLCSYSLKSLDFTDVTLIEAMELIEGSDLYLLEWMQNSYFEILELLKKCVEQFIEFKSSPRSCLLYELFGENLKKQCPTTLHPLQRTWLFYNHLEYQRKKRREIQHYVTLVVGANNGNLGQKISRDFDTEDRKLRQQLNPEIKEEVVSSDGSHVVQVDEASWNEQIAEFEQEINESPSTMSPLELDDDIDSDFGNVGII